MAVSSGESQANINSLLGQGYTQEQLSSFNYGNKLNSNEMANFQAQFKPTPSVGQTVQQGISQLGGQQYQFDPNQYLPAIQGQAESIYSPQQAQLEAIRQLQQASAQDTRVQTEKDFAKKLSQEVEAINARGGFFQGGAIAREGEISDQKSSALLQLDLQAGAANYSNYAQQAMLAAEKTQFIQDRLVNSESSAYARWADQRNFSLSALQSQYQVYASERDFARNVFESDRTFAQQEEQFKKQYDLTQAEFKMAKEEFKINMDIKKLSYADALDDFKNKYAKTNTGIWGMNGSNDMVDFLGGIFKAMGGTVKSGNPVASGSDGSVIFDFDYDN